MECMWLLAREMSLAHFNGYWLCIPNEVFKGLRRRDEDGISTILSIVLKVDLGLVPVETPPQISGASS